MNQQVLHGLSRIASVLRHEAWASAGPEGLTPTQAQVLTLLEARAKAMRVSDAARELAVTAATASDAIRSLEEKRMLTRRASKEDRRNVYLHLSAKGRRTAQRLSQWPDFLMAAADSLDEREAGVFLVALTKMIRHLQEEGRIPVARMCVSCAYFHPNRYTGSATPHHCHFVDAPFGNQALRIDCGDFEAADEDLPQSAWQQFLRTAPSSKRDGAQFVELQHKERTR